MDASCRPMPNPALVLGAVEALLAASPAGGAAALPLPVSTAALRLPLLLRARHGNDHAVLAAPAPPPTDADFSPALVAPPPPPPSDSTFGTLLAPDTWLLIPPHSWLNATSAKTSPRHIPTAGHGPPLRSLAVCLACLGALPPPPALFAVEPQKCRAKIPLTQPAISLPLHAPSLSPCRKTSAHGSACSSSCQPSSADLLAKKTSISGGATRVQRCGALVPPTVHLHRRLYDSKPTRRGALPPT